MASELTAIHQISLGGKSIAPGETFDPGKDRKWMVENGAAVEVGEEPPAPAPDSTKPSGKSDG